MSLYYRVMHAVGKTLSKKLEKKANFVSHEYAPWLDDR